MMHRFVIALSALCLFTTGIAASCGGDDDDDSSASGPTYGPQNCDTGNDTDTDTGTGSSCSESEMNDYTDCILDACSDDYKKCYGDNWKDGDFSGGECEDLFTCMNKCTCDNLQTCGGECYVTDYTSGTCATCQASMSTCMGKCTMPECMTQ